MVGRLAILWQIGRTSGCLMVRFFSCGWFLAIFTIAWPKIFVLAVFENNSILLRLIYQWQHLLFNLRLLRVALCGEHTAVWVCTIMLASWCRQCHCVCVCAVGGTLVALALQTKLKARQIEIWNTINQWNFYQNFWMSMVMVMVMVYCFIWLSQ